MPPTVVPSTGQKTHGRFVDPEGKVHALASGYDAMYEPVEKYLLEIKVRRRPLRASDVEMKLAVHMRNNGIKSGTLIINNVPCAGILGCDELLPVLLPEGTTLTILGAEGFKQTYHGGKKSKWFP
ncbi:DddA-like double-stranded DNA deaminase toxin [Actinokineospora sp. G85]|uniref:DddA-like double-stranded DNA deaminase toxin n=1 Tax=Actinokineospora sp. G85 TaxID=3406626 RepID=UPI003C7308F9